MKNTRLYLNCFSRLNCEICLFDRSFEKTSLGRGQTLTGTSPAAAHAL